MAKTVKLSNDTYLDSTGVMHDKVILSKYLNVFPKSFSVKRGGKNYYYAKIATTSTTKTYDEKNLVILVKGTHASNADRVAIINISFSTNASKIIYKYSFEAFAGTTNFDSNDIHFEYNDDVTANVWLKIDTNQYASWQVTILSNNGWDIDLNSKTVSTTSLPSDGYTGVSLTKSF